MLTFNGDTEKSFTVNGFEKGISENPTVGFFQMVNANNHASPGLLKSTFRLNRTTKLKNWRGSNTPITFAASNDGSGKLLLTTSDSQYENDSISYNKQAFTVTTTGTLPTGLAINTIYYAIKVSGTTMKVATTLANADSGIAIAYTNAGTGVHTLVPINPKSIVQFDTDQIDAGNTICGLDTDGRVWAAVGSNFNWVLIDGNSSGPGDNGGVAYWKGYWFFFKGNKVDVISAVNLNNLTPTWTLVWAGTGGNFGTNLQGRPHITLVGQDNILYFCNGKFIGSVKEVSGQVFDPANGATYLTNDKALDLPFNSTALEELRTYLVIGTTFNKVYFWDRISPSFEFPLSLPEKNTFDIVNMDNILYFLTGYSGTIYKSNGVSVEVAKKIPEHLSNYYYSASTQKVKFYQADRLSKRIVFNTLIQDATGNLLNAIWSYYPAIDSLVIENTITDTAETANFEFWALKMINEKSYIVSYKKDGFSLPTDYSIASVDANGGSIFIVCSNFQSTNFNDTPTSATTELFSLGTHLNTATINQTEISLAKKLTAGQGVNIYYRFNITDSFTLLKTIDFATYGAVNNITVETPLQSIKELQIKIELNNGSLPFGGTNPSSIVSSVEFKHARFILG